MARQCRFCLQDTQKKENPLIAPCDCKGSLEFVHLHCLQKWILMNPQRNGFGCGICLTAYFRSYIPELERIPEKGIVVKFLDFPIVFAILYHYLYLFHISALYVHWDQRTIDLYLFYQWIFQVLYFVAFGCNFRVKNIGLYTEALQKKETLLYPLTHLLFLYLLHNGVYHIGLLFDIFLSSYYYRHITILKGINLRLTNGMF